LVVKTKFLVDARGRRHSLAGDDGTPQTVALSAPWALVDQACAQTRVEAGSDEWLWGSPLPAHRYGVTIFLDPSRVAGLHKDVRAELYRRILSRSQLMKCLLQGSMIGPVTVRDATPHTVVEPIGSDFIRIGEASISIDPLSSQGIQTVLVSAIQGTAAVHTILTAGCDPIPPFEFYRNRQLAAAVSHRVMSARLYQASRGQTPFWKHRARVTHHPQAVDQLQRKASKMPSQVSVAQSLRVVEVPVLCGAFIRRIPALCHPRLSEPVAYFAGFPLAPLVREACGASSTDEILQRWTRRISAEAAWSIIAWMWSVGILIAQADP
jgi:hypothetical protein